MQVSIIFSSSHKIDCFYSIEVLAWTKIYYENKQKGTNLENKGGS